MGSQNRQIEVNRQIVNSFYLTFVVNVVIETIKGLLHFWRLKWKVIKTEKYHI